MRFMPLHVIENELLKCSFMNMLVLSLLLRHEMCTSGYTKNKPRQPRPIRVKYWFMNQEVGRSLPCDPGQGVKPAT